MKNLTIYALLFCFIVINLKAQSQTVTTIDYANKTFSTTCNIFATAINVSNYEHLTTLSRPEYDDNSVGLRTDNNHATIYSIKYAFKVGYKYKIRAYYRGQHSGSDQGYPDILLTLSATNGGNASGTNCEGPSAISNNDLNAFVRHVSGSSYAWGDNLVDITVNTAYQYILIGAVNDPNNNGYPAEIFVRKIEITETPPTFTLTPSPTVDVSLNSTPSKTFTITNVDNAAGATYDWNLGSSSNGWLYNGSPAPQNIPNVNPLTLVPSSNCGSLNNVSATVKLSGVNFQTLNCSITRSIPSNNLSISDNLPFCSTSNPYEINNLPSGATVVWSVNTSGIVTVDNPTSTSTTLTKISDGDITLTATVSLSGGCAPIVITKQISLCTCETWDNPVLTILNNTPSSGEPLNLVVSPEYKDALYYLWYINGQLVATGGTFVTIYNWPCTDEGEGVTVVAVTGCSISNTVYGGNYSPTCSYGGRTLKKNTSIGSISEDYFATNKNTSVNIYPNPALNSITVTMPTDIIEYKKTAIRIFDGLGKQVKTIVPSSNISKIDISTLPLGNYVVLVFDGKITTIKKIIKQ